MAICTFFGHRDCPDFIASKLWETLVELVTRQGVECFYVGNQGGFDRLVLSALRRLQKEYPHIQYAVVLAHYPQKPGADWEPLETLLPEGIETVPPRFAISWRNQWMLRQADYVLTYVTHSWGGAAKWEEKARRAGKQVRSLGD